eukprot:TRINITY_DN62042_c0_g1_i2.p1 TRINITY_DN62042_c0_g1~~TRINITY_DN62042_c0_g1_i2.p1  ORF type:complete len:446 (-),score=42.16 TRINITY_DN62042_c0_g1_i2:421-1758(-)
MAGAATGRIFIIFVVIVAIVVVGGWLGMMWFLCKRRKQRAQHTLLRGSNPPRREVVQNHSSSSPSQDQSLNVDISGFPADLPLLTYADLVAATNNFTQKIGEGGFGVVYTGRYLGRSCAFKVLKVKDASRYNEFVTEIKILRQCWHPSLVPLFAVCVDRELALVYPLLSRGNLQDALAQGGLLWNQRLAIAHSITMGLKFLHTQTPPILHRDLKSANVLLDENSHARISDFGVSREAAELQTQTHVSTRMVGTPGYIDPQLLYGRVNAGTDIYALGIVLLELISGLPAFSNTFEPPLLSQRFVGVAQHNKDYTGAKLVDSTAGEWPEGAVDAVVDCALQCIDQDNSKRPSLDVVTGILDSLLSIPGPPSTIQPIEIKECIVCMDQPRNCVFLPCHHFVCCTTCGGICIARRDKCPLCRSNIQSFTEGKFTSTHVIPSQLSAGGHR